MGKEILIFGDIEIDPTLLLIMRGGNLSFLRKIFPCQK